MAYKVECGCKYGHIKVLGYFRSKEKAKKRVHGALARGRKCCRVIRSRTR